MDEQTLANLIIDHCQETDPKVKAKLRRVIKVCGPVKSAQIFKEACALYTAKIDYVVDPNTQEKRLRTLGGCFFKLARKRMTKKERKEVK